MLNEAPLTAKDILETRAERYADHIALVSPDQPPLTYGTLAGHTRQIAAQLQRAGIGRGDRIAIVMPDSAELGVAVLSIVSIATAVFLKSTPSADEYADLFSRTRAKAVMLEYGIPSAARDTAQALRLPIWDIQPRSSGTTGLFDLDAPESITPAEPDFARIDDVVWLHLTSGTTDRPKIVPITHRMIWHRAATRVEMFELTDKDRWLSLTSLTHSATTVNWLRCLLSGGTAMLPRNFDAAQFFDYLETFQPTWLSAPATTYQAILANAAFRQKSLAGSSVRFIGAASMSLPLELMQNLERAFQVPVLQGYGTTETGSIAQNPLPPALNKPGSVGWVTIQALQIVDGQGRSLPAGTAGEIVVRGPTVISGYENDPEANQQAFTGDWFRSGDLGYLDGDGYLFVIGRIKDMINRGGEMIAPPQIENALLIHPAVAQAVVFSIPDQRLGEDVGAAVVLHSGHNVTEKELRAFVAATLSATKIPRHIRFVDDLARNDMGKILRAGLAEKFGLTSEVAPDSDPQSAFVAPRTPLERQLAGLWEAVLGIQQVGIYDEFLNMGGDSLAATRLISRLRGTLQIDINLLDFFDAPTIAQQADVVEKLLAHS